MSPAGVALDRTWRAESGRILAGLIRRLGDFDRAEEALQAAAERALARWPVEGVPTNPGAWLTLVAQRAAVDRLRRDGRHVSADDWLAARPHADGAAVPEAEALAADELARFGGDDRLRLLFTCCHPSLAPPVQASLALRTLCGLEVPQIARAFLEPEATTAQRLVRAKRKIADARIPYEVPGPDELPARVGIVLRVVYLLFAEGHVGTVGDALVRPELCDEALRLAALVAELLPRSAEALGLYALLRLQDARRAARTDAAGRLVPLEEQDRTRWDSAAIAAGRDALDRALALAQPGPFQVQAAIAELHSRALDPRDTDWEQIAALYRALLRHEPTPVVELNAAIALAMARGPNAGLEWLAALEARGELARTHYLPAAKAELLRRAGAHAAAASAYREALTRVVNCVEREYLERRLAEVDAGST